MKNGLFEAIINFFKSLHSDAIVFTKGFVVGTLGSGIILLNAKIGNYDTLFVIVIKLCYIGATGLLTGMAVTIGKKIVNAAHNWWLKRKKKREKPKYPFSKNGKQERA